METSNQPRRSATEIRDHIVDDMSHIYLRPLMYGGTAEGVDTLLWHLHNIWGFIVGREEEVQQAFYAISAEEGCGSASFAGHFNRTKPEPRTYADEQATAGYVVEQWRKVDERLGIQIRVDASTLAAAQQSPEQAGLSATGDDDSITGEELIIR